jgi:hypothetical protein
MTDKPFPDLQAELRASQTFRVNDAPMACDGICICDPRPVEPRRRDLRGVYALAGAGAGLLLIFLAWQASAAERVTPGPHDLWLILKPTAIEWAAANEQRNAFRIGTDFEDRAECERKKRAMRKVAGTLQCLPKDN